MKNLIITILLAILLFNPKTLHQPEEVQHYTKASLQEILRQQQCLTEVLFHEVRGEPIEGIKAVLSVVHNRTKAKGFPSDYCGVVHQPYQFSYRNSIKPGRTLPINLNKLQGSEKKIYTIIQELSFIAAVGAFNPVLEDSVNFYHSVKISTKWSRKMKKVATIGSHQFFKQT